ncbi:hypothetical protein EIN_328870 [Entamoeba invadens IP1]|uniref:Uncharacterized protein n=1 Tax=Entamoeba invadens IP1 TaxID=370355 RepID=A0A0A1TXS7_ENTIV|nr:hypothetical protein EIN_328870 [Entamoeba invadens IP1]ELP86180.1 hypothetical protein EIN_328870 [Entamoeba invadens IP1]|eukprot:XP_004185526.1 hypothetical protein EIN_328870 [Entamoeba invadens IP1]
MEDKTMSKRLSDDSTYDSKKLSKREKHTLDSRVNKNKRSVQLSFLIGLVNQVCGVTYERPRKRSSQTHQFFKVKTLNFKDEVVNVENFLEAQCKWCSTQPHQLSKKNLKHKMDEEKMVVLFEFLVDVATEFGFLFFTSKMKNKFNRNKIDFIEEIYFGNKLAFGYKQIEVIGERINAQLFSMTSVQCKEHTLLIKDIALNTHFERK